MRGIAPIMRLMMNECIHHVHTHTHCDAIFPIICQMEVDVASEHVKWKGNRLKIGEKGRQKDCMKVCVCVCSLGWLSEKQLLYIPMVNERENSIVKTQMCVYYVF